jgi:hypothetical protein
MLIEWHEVIAPGIRHGRRVTRGDTPATCPPPCERQGLVPPPGLVGPVVGRPAQHASLSRDPTLTRSRAVALKPGDLVRAYIVNVGPGVSAIHVMGTILDSVYDGASTARNIQT